MPANHRSLFSLRVSRTGLLAAVLLLAGRGALSANPPATSETNETKILPSSLTAGALASRVSMSGTTMLVGAYRCSHD